MRAKTFVGSAAALALFSMGGCIHRGISTQAHVAEVTQAAASGFRVLDLSAFRGYETMEVPAGWTVAGNEITKSHGTGDIMTKDQFSNFELELEWKIGKGGNSGIFYHATKEYDHIYWSGPEYQLLDDANAGDGKNPLTSAASAYGLYAPPRGVVKPADEWNTTRIIVKGAHVEHWLNGQKVVEYELWSPDWKAKVAASKFKDWPNYGLAKRGYIGIQGDHNGTLSIRNIRIRELP
ncbi:MAG TPA: DUF1080 domain-containing protein [Gemmatimonadaceae bacterium]|jgi:hypothetical protein|nr:DUF1080 domain-containing protein [Gemmatimonadaceae bacterium]